MPKTGVSRSIQGPRPDTIKNALNRLKKEMGYGKRTNS